MLIAPHECPNCHAPISRLRVLCKSLFSRWSCRACGAVLRIDRKRRILACFPWIAIVYVLVVGLHVFRLGPFVVFPTLIGLGMINFMLFDRVRVETAAGFRCRNCGYDLTGQTEGRCPECGESFDWHALEAYRTGTGRSLSGPHRRATTAFLIMLLIFALSTMLVVGLSIYQRTAASRAALPTATSRPASTSGAVLNGG
jgi:hypothetical protein